MRDYNLYAGKKNFKKNTGGKFAFKGREYV